MLPRGACIRSNACLGELLASRPAANMQQHGRVQEQIEKMRVEPLLPLTACVPRRLSHLPICSDISGCKEQIENLSTVLPHCYVVQHPPLNIPFNKNPLQRHWRVQGAD